MPLHHIHDLQQSRRTFSSLLKTTGYLCIADLEKEDGTFHSGSSFDGHYGFDKEELSELLSQNGLKVVYYSQSYTLKRERDGIVKEFPLFMMIAQKIN
jgi:hypothetical protein